MRAILQCAIAVVCGTALLSVAAGWALAQSASSGAPATAAGQAAPAPPAVHYHYHFHQHNYPAAPSANPSAAQSMSPYYPGPYASWGQTAPGGAISFGQTYAGGSAGQYVGRFAPLPQQNLNSAAPTAQGVIHVFLPTAEATVSLNGQRMRGKGSDRKLTTGVLQPNTEYQYWVTAHFNRDGQTVTEYRKVDVGTGEYVVADFIRPPPENPISLPTGPVDPNTVAPDSD